MLFASLFPLTCLIVVQWGPRYTRRVLHVSSRSPFSSLHQLYIGRMSSFPGIFFPINPDLSVLLTYNYSAMAIFPSLFIAYTVALLNFSQSVFPAPANPLAYQSTAVPTYVTRYGNSISRSRFFLSLIGIAPVVWLESEDRYSPSDIATQLTHTVPEINFKPVNGAPSPLSLDNLDQLNANNGANVYLTSVDDVTTNPPWLTGVKPDGSGKTVGATSCAVIVNDHGSGLVDAFFMYFYAYNWGGRILGQNVDDHVGDW